MHTFVDRTEDNVFIPDYDIIMDRWRHDGVVLEDDYEQSIITLGYIFDERTNFRRGNHSSKSSKMNSIPIRGHNDRPSSSYQIYLN